MDLSENKKRLAKVVLHDMTLQERKDWIYQHLDDDQMLWIISEMSEDEVEQELNKIK
jgi:hypothetical protein